MRRAGPVAGLAALAAVGALAPVAGAAGKLQLAELEGARFPDRAFVLTLPKDAPLDRGRIMVRENGEPVSGLSVVPATAADAREFAVVLVIDASMSMRGDAVADAVDAARSFAARRSEGQALAIVAFNSKAHVLLPLTTSREAIDGALASNPRLAEGTHIYDAVDSALSLLKESDAAVASVIVLSDGADTGSRTTAGDVVARARREGVRVFTVGLLSRQFEAAPLASLARTTGGRYAEATDTADLERVFDALGARLAGEYLVRYRSEARPDVRVHVAVRVDGFEGIAISEYVTPARLPSPEAPFRRPLVERFVESGAGMVATSVAFAVLVGIGVMVLLRPRPRTLRRRLSEFVSVAVGDRRRTPGPSDLVLARAERSFSETRWWARFRDDLELAGITVAPLQIVLGTFAGTAVVAALGYLVAGLLLAPLGLVLPLFVRAFVTRRVERKRMLFADQLPDNLQVLSSALRAGHTMTGALSVLIDDCAEPSRSEFRRVVADEQLGAPLEDALMVVARRMRNADLEQVALVAALQRETGGNTAEVLERVADTVRSRFEIRRLVRTLTTQGRMSRWVLTVLPVGLLGIMAAINPGYLAPFFSNPAGRALLLVAAGMVVTGSLVIKRIVNIKV